MEIHPLLLQFGGSLVAIFALFLLARALKLGGSPRLEDEQAVQSAAAEVEDGFEAQRISISRDKQAAIAADNSGRIMVIRRHGNRFAGRILSRQASVREEVDALVIDPGEKRYGAVRLRLGDPGYWADAINRL